MSSFLYLKVNNNLERVCQEKLINSIQIDNLKHLDTKFHDIYLIMEFGYSGSLVKWKKVNKKFTYILNENIIDFFTCLKEENYFPSFFLRFEQGDLLTDKESNTYVNITNLRKEKISSKDLKNISLQENTRYILS